MGGPGASGGTGAALGTAARGFAAPARRGRHCRDRCRPGRTGIDYLRIIAERHRREIHAQLRVIDLGGLLADLRAAGRPAQLASDQWALRGRLRTPARDR